MNYIHIFIFVFLYSFSQLVSSAQANPENAAVLVYGWSHKDGCPKMLMSYEPLKAAWTLPGGRKTPTQSIQQAAAHELYEETAAYPYFTPSQTLPLIQKADRSHWFFSGYNNNTITYCIMLPEGVDAHANIGDNWRQRTAHLNADYKEMTQWHWIKLDLMSTHFQNNKNVRITPEGSAGGPVAVNAKIGHEILPIRNVTYRALQNFAKRHNNFNKLIADSTPAKIQKVAALPSQAAKASVPVRSAPPSRAVLGDIATGVITLHNQLQMCLPPTTDMLSAMSGHTTHILKRGPTPAEFNILVRSLKAIVLSSTLGYEAFMDSEIITSTEPHVRNHQTVVWASLNILRSDLEKDAILSMINPSLQEKVERILSASTGR